MERGVVSVRGAAFAIWVALAMSACAASPSSPSPSPAAPPDAPSVPARIVYRPELRFSDGRTRWAGVAFLLDTGGGQNVIATSGHLARNLQKGAELVTIRLLDNATGAAVAEVESLAGPPGATFDGLDYSTDVAMLNVRGAAANGPAFTPAGENARVGDVVEITACPPDRMWRRVSMASTQAAAASIPLF